MPDLTQKFTVVVNRRRRVVTLKQLLEAYVTWQEHDCEEEERKNRMCNNCGAGYDEDGLCDCY